MVVVVLLVVEMVVVGAGKAVLGFGVRVGG